MDELQIEMQVLLCIETWNDEKGLELWMNKMRTTGAHEIN